MRTSHVRSLSLAVLASLVLAGTSAAQDKSAALLLIPEVQMLINRGAPADHARLAAHFTALADRYAADARRHTSMAQSSSGNPNRNLGTGMTAHCKRLASLSTQSATAVRELVTYHQKLAAGVAATPPAGGSRFEAGAGARVPTDDDLIALAGKANTPADHRTLEEYFQTMATRYAAEAKEHTMMAQAYRGLARPTGAASLAAHCDSLANIARDSAKEATEAAAMHKQLAGAAR